MKKIKLRTLLASTAIFALCGFALFYWITSQRSEGYIFASTSEDPLVAQLFRKEIRSGMRIDPLLEKFRPSRERRTGPYVVYQFEQEGLDWKTLTAKNGLLESATIGSCTFSYLFFDEVSDEHKTALSRANWIEDNADKYPDQAAELSSALAEQLAILED